MLNYFTPQSALAGASSVTSSDVNSLTALPASASPTPATLSLAPATSSQLLGLRAIPSGMLVRSRRQTRRQRKGEKLAREGQIISKFYNEMASRPYPTNGISLEQQITLELTNFSPSVITSSGTAGVNSYASFQVNLALFAGATTITAVFDQYKFEQLEVWLDPIPTVAGSSCFLTSAVDLDDSNVPTTPGQVLDHQGSLSGTGGSAGHYHKWKPHMAIAAYSGAFTSYSNSPATWIDVASPAVQHFGLKMAAVSTGNVVAFQLTYRAVISFRAPAIA